MKIDKENELAKLAKTGDEKAVVELFNLQKKYYTAWIINNKYLFGQTIDEDLFQDFYFQFKKILDMWEPEKKASFRTLLYLSFKNFYVETKNKSDEISEYHKKVNNLSTISKDSSIDFDIADTNKSSQLIENQLIKKQLYEVFKQKKIKKREIELIELMFQGFLCVECAKIMNYTTGRIYQIKHDIEKKLGIKDLNQILIYNK